VEFRFVVEGAHRTGKGGLAGGANEAPDPDSGEFTPLPRDPLTSALAMS